MIRWAAFACIFLAVVVWVWQPLKERVVPGTGDLTEIKARVIPFLETALDEQALQFGAPVFIRIFKAEAELEVWVKDKDGDRFTRFKTYPICNFSGDLGPKLKEGDLQSPEGIYNVGKQSLNPNSRFHLSFNLGFPNAFDRAQGRTGSFLMVHGDCLSIGCYAMTDPAIEEIYLLVEAALDGGQRAVPVHAFPFRMSDDALKAYAGHPWRDFWDQLQPIYQDFEERHQIPQVDVVNGQYMLKEAAES